MQQVSEIKVFLPDKEECSYPLGTRYLDILKDNKIESSDPVVLVKANNRICDLKSQLANPAKIEWVTLSSPFGKRAYQQTLCLVLIRALEELYPDYQLLIDHSLGKGLFCELTNSHPLTSKIIQQIKNRMGEIIRSDDPVKPVPLRREEAIEYLQKNGQNPESLFPASRNEIVTFHQCGHTLDYFGYALLPSTGFLDHFDLTLYESGMILHLPDLIEKQTFSLLKPIKLFRVFQEYSHWGHILDADHPSKLNDSIKNGEIHELIKIAEGLHEKRMAQIADTIKQNRKNLRVILIAGPSSSGKTTSTKRLSIQLRVNGMHPLSISLDDYFLDRDKTPLGADGKPDFESIYALDIDRFNQDLLHLLDGKQITIPIFDFLSGKSIEGQNCQVGKNEPILIEGLHALNNELTLEIPSQNKFKLYISALTQMNLTNHLRIPTSDVRFLRRLVRDHLFRGRHGVFTLEHWSKVRQGEEEYIFPFQEEADAIFNTSLFYEPSVLRNLAIPILETIPEDHPQYPESYRILRLIEIFEPIPVNYLPGNSILREFVGGSSFKY